LRGESCRLTIAKCGGHADRGVCVMPFQRLILAIALATTIAACGPDTRDASPARQPAEQFVDATETSRVQFTHFNGMHGEFYLAEITGAGVALFDYDNDGKTRHSGAAGHAA